MNIRVRKGYNIQAIQRAYRGIINARVNSIIFDAKSISFHCQHTEDRYVMCVMPGLKKQAVGRIGISVYIPGMSESSLLGIDVAGESRT
jgi:hypothetical protein